MWKIVLGVPYGGGGGVNHTEIPLSVNYMFINFSFHMLL